MARYRKHAEVEPFPRELLDQVVRALLDAVEEAPVTERGFEFGDEVIGDVRLVEGRHLAAGARYRGEGEGLVIEAHVPAWNRAGESRIEVTGVSGGHTVDLRLDLRMSGRRLHSVRVTGGYRGPKPFRGLRRARWEGELRVDEWWSSHGSKTSPLSLRVVHPFAFADLRVARRKDGNGRWSVQTTARFGGRSLLRPLAAVGLAVKRKHIRRILDEGIGRAVSGWNAEVPGVAKRGMRERLDFEHRVTLKAVSREWVEEYAGALHQGIEKLDFESRELVKSPESAYSVRLLKGKHIGPGTRYRIALGPDDEVEPLDVNVAAWDFGGPNRIEVSSPDDVQTGWAEIDSAREPRVVRAGFAGLFEDMPVTATAEADLGRWWSAGSLLSGSAEIPVGAAALAVERVADADGEWTVDVSATIEGRAWARHLIAVAGVLSGPAMTRSFRESADAFAEKWNRAVPGTGPAEVAADSTIRAVLGH
ncbi:hypothetical protein [Actinomadura sp. GTD37]|uniref:hypothetical protein n=1 Tax=Actinomadura sp. GTD37 TaxID=1778030 RepID=UPI0035BF5084